MSELDHKVTEERARKCPKEEKYASAGNPGQASNTEPNEFWDYNREQSLPQARDVGDANMSSYEEDNGQENDISDPKKSSLTKTYQQGTEPSNSMLQQARTLSSISTEDGQNSAMSSFTDNNDLAHITQTNPDPGLSPGKATIATIGWKCRCGRIIYDDVTELQPGAVLRYCQEIQNQLGPAVIQATTGTETSNSNSVLGQISNWSCGREPHAALVSSSKSRRRLGNCV